MALRLTVNLTLNIIQYIDSEIPPDSISEHLFFKIFLGGMPPDPLALACYACCLCFAQWLKASTLINYVLQVP